MKEEISSYSSNLFPYDDIVTKEIESWKNGFAFALRADNKKLFME